MEKVLVSARGKPGSKCGCALDVTKKAAAKKAPVKPVKKDAKLPPWLNKKKAG